jgi:hypothetical protein
MRSQWMALPGTHDPGIAEEFPVGVFKDPTTETVPLECNYVTGKFGVAFSSVQRTAQILHDFGIGV